MNQLVDTHQAVKDLVDIGLPESHAEGIVKIQARFLNEDEEESDTVLAD